MKIHTMNTCMCDISIYDAFSYMHNIACKKNAIFRAAASNKILGQ